MQSVPAAKSDPKPTQRVSGARVFTSDECIRILEEKEAEKKRKEEEKQQNKLERERKRHEREEIAAEKKKRKEEKQTATKPKKKAEPKNREKDTTENDSICPICSSRYSFDVEEGNGRDWIQCACGIWLHDDCIPEAIVEAIIQEKEEEKEATELHCCPECIDYDDI